MSRLILSMIKALIGEGVRGTEGDGVLSVVDRGRQQRAGRRGARGVWGDKEKKEKVLDVMGEYVRKAQVTKALMSRCDTFLCCELFLI